MRGLGRHLGEISSSSWGKETKCPKYAGSIINTRREMRIDCVSYASWKPLNYLHMSFGQQGTLIRSPSEKCTGKGRGWGVSRFAQQIWTPLSKFRRPPSTLQSASSSNVTEYVRNSLRRQIKIFPNFWQQASQWLDLAKFTLNPPTSTYPLNLDINKVWFNPDDINMAIFCGLKKSLLVKCWNILMEYFWWCQGFRWFSA